MHCKDKVGSARRSKRLRLIGLALAAGISGVQAHAAIMSGTFTSDDQVQLYTFSQTSTGLVNFSTDSYGGGTVNGITTPAGGFVPVLSIFNASTGLLIGSDGADEACSGAMKIDLSTHICDDASLTLSLASGSYIVALSEFLNVPNGPGISNGFLEQGQGNFTGTATCGVAGSFYESDLAPCVQRNGNFAVNVATVPEPSELWLALPALAFGVLKRRHWKS